MLKSDTYDFIIIGAGCAGLSLIMRLIKSGQFTDKKILLIDKDSKKKNDRTWCYWETTAGFFDEIVYKKWGSVSFLSDSYSSETDIHPYQYKMVRGIDFYNYCLQQIVRNKNIEFINGEVKGWEVTPAEINLRINEEGYQLKNTGTQIFNSIYRPDVENKKNIMLLQHFKGWKIETHNPIFNTEQATIMDFRVHQNHGTSFVYVLPFSSTSALVEYTLFTKELLQPQQYEIELKEYINSFLQIPRYRIIEEEFGKIPMTNEDFNFKSDNGWNIGTAGGQTKASSGYTFQFIQKQSQLIVDHLIAGKSLNNLKSTPRRFRFYDSTLLYILYHNILPGKKVFSDLFKKNKPQQVLKFLDNESSVFEELKIISSLPKLPFLKAALKQI